MTTTTNYGTSIGDAVSAALETHPYYAGAINRLRLKADPAVPTMATSAQWVTHYNPATVASWTRDEAGAVLVHEIEHLMRHHAERAGTREHGRWNRAADAEINEHLEGLPEGCIYPETLGTARGRNAETYYGAAAPDPQDPDTGDDGAKGDGEGDDGAKGDGGAQGDDGEATGDGSGSGEGDGAKGGAGTPGTGSGDVDCGSASGGDARPWESGDELNPGAGAADDGEAARTDVARAILAGEGHSADLTEWAEREIGIDRSAWYSALASVLGSAMSPHGAPTRWNWTPRRDSRDMAGAVLPRWTSTRPACAVIVDTSGSVTPFDRELAKAAAHFIGRMADATYYFCDDVPTRVGSHLPDRIPAGGGTDMGAGIAMAIADGAKAIVIITDMVTPWGEDPGVPVIIGANPGAHEYMLKPGAIYPRMYPIPEWVTVIPVVAADGTGTGD